MASDRITVSRALLRAALIDAIESVEQLIGGAGGDEATRKRLADYRRTLASRHVPRWARRQVAQSRSPRSGPASSKAEAPARARGGKARTGSFHRSRSEAGSLYRPVADAMRSNWHGRKQRPFRARGKRRRARTRPRAAPPKRRGGSNQAERINRAIPEGLAADQADSRPRKQVNAQSQH